MRHTSLGWKNSFTRAIEKHRRIRSDDERDKSTWKGFREGWRALAPRWSVVLAKKYCGNVAHASCGERVFLTHLMTTERALAEVDKIKATRTEL